MSEFMGAQLCQLYYFLNDFYKDFLCKLNIFPSISMRDIVSIVLKGKYIKILLELENQWA